MELNSIIFPQLKSKISLEAFLNGKLTYIPKLKKISEDSQIPMSPRSSRPSEMMARYPAHSVKATKNIAFEQRNDSPSKPIAQSKFPPSPLNQKPNEKRQQTQSPTISMQKRNTLPTSTTSNAKNEVQQNLHQHIKEEKGRKEVNGKRSSQQKSNAQDSSWSLSHISTFSTEEVSCLTETSSSHNTPKNINNSRVSIFAAAAGKRCICCYNQLLPNTSNADTYSYSCICAQSEQCLSASKQAANQHSNGNQKSNNISQFSLSAQKSPSVSEYTSPHRLTQSAVIDRSQQRDSVYSRNEVLTSSIGNDQLNYKSINDNQFKISESQLYNPNFMGYDINLYQAVGYVPALYLNSNSKSDNLLIYFHANGEDIFSSYPLLNHLRQTLEINIIGVEYPGYGSYKTQQNCTADLIQEDAQYVFDFVTKQLKFQLKNIILLGRSIGTGPATYLASKHKVGALVLISAFTSIRGIVEDFAWFFKYMIKERFNNLDNIKNVTSPTFLLHGKKDSLISYKQSVTLSQHCKSICEMNTSAEMNHSTFNYTDDLSIPLLNFLFKCNYPLGKKNLNRKSLPEGLTYHPKHIQMGISV